MRLLCALGLFLTLLHLSTPFLLGAFNIKCFGITKSSDSKVMDIISQIVQRYDIVLIQEVRDSDLSATNRLMEHVNNRYPQPVYSHIVSEPLGPSSYKERYLFLYRAQTVSVTDSYTYNNARNAFSREPFVVKFYSTQIAVQNFVLIPQHTCPRKAVQEMDALYDVVVDARSRWNTNHIVLLGDFNAGCSYVKADDWRNISLFTNGFDWLIKNDADTTVSSTTHCPYDRIVVTTDMERGVKPNSAKVYDYMTDMGLSQKEALDVSDHFPVEVTLAP